MSVEKDIIISVLNDYKLQIPLLDTLNLSNIINNFIYQNMEEYYPNQQLKCKYTLRFGEKDGLYQELYLRTHNSGEDNTLSVECTYRDGHKVGVYKSWHRGGSRWMEFNYEIKNGISEREGTFVSWYENGQKSVECTFKDGCFIGLYKSWHENGVRSIVCTYSEEDKLGGLYETWYTNGVKHTECYFKEDKYIDLYQEWDSSGILIKKVEY